MTRMSYVRLSFGMRPSTIRRVPWGANPDGKFNTVELQPDPTLKCLACMDYAHCYIDPVRCVGGERIQCPNCMVIFQRGDGVSEGGYP
jgi:hypothetical protein